MHAERLEHGAHRAAGDDAGAGLGRTQQNLARAREVLALLGLSRVSNEYVGNLSGGQRKLVDLGRMLMAKPKMCLLDEPTAGVNPSLINVIVDALGVMRADEDITLLIVEHNTQVVARLCDEVYVLAAGSVIARGTPEEIREDDNVITSYLGTNEDVVNRSGRRGSSYSASPQPRR